jgi:hypothetical protein
VLVMGMSGVSYGTWSCGLRASSLLGSVPGLLLSHQSWRVDHRLSCVCVVGAFGGLHLAVSVSFHGHIVIGTSVGWPYGESGCGPILLVLV